MLILNRYMGRNYLATFLMSVAVFSFIMCIGSVIRAIDLMSRGISAAALLKFFFLSFPYILQFTVPMSAMTTALLVAMRLSMDGEINAFKASGVNLWQLVAPLVLVSVLLSFVAMGISNFVSPSSKYAQRTITAQLGDSDPIALLEEGRYVRDFPGHMIYVGRKRGDRAEDISIYVIDEETNRIEMNLRARSGTLKVDKANRKLLVDMYDVRIERPDAADPLNPSRTRTMTAEYYPKRIDLDELFKSGKKVKKKISDLNLVELIRTIRELPVTMKDLKPIDRAREQMQLMVEANTRMALSVSCFAFTLLGIPLGMQSKRKESSAGLGISLLIVFIFYTCIALTKPLADRPELRPDLLVWIPVAIAEIAGVILIHRHR